MSADELRGLLGDWAREAAVPGVSVGIAYRGEETLLTAGVSSVDTQLPVDDDTLFMIGSTSKTFAATAALVLVEDGVLELDAPIAGYLPELRLSDPVARETVTLRHLLTHSSGFLGDIEVDTGWGDDALARAVRKFDELPQIFPVGEVFSYCNAGFLLAGRLVEAVSGLPYEEFVRTRLLAPLEMTDSFFQPWEVLTRRHAVGHAMREDGPAVAHLVGLSRSDAPAGGLWSTARDQLKWARFQLSGGKVLSDETRKLMQAAQRPAALAIEEVGLSWLRQRHGGTQLVRHGGNVSNLQLSEFQLAPSEDLAVTVLTNSVGGSALGPRIVDWCLEHLAGLPSLESAPAVAVEPGEFLGKFETGALALEVTERDGSLWAQMLLDSDSSDIVSPPPFEVVFVGEDLLARATDTRRPSARFRRDGHGRVDALEFGGRTALRLPGGNHG
ncbi:serine hydrolase domain-containing protein [Amycolatopsis benzoatilytica]|uniref:serine hydrolase domain-containing protein n=1 Tax=Amycolatopsis benzoatilytica TaxID=346045 RepID=UPI00037D67EB|nr:serine hydrolase domain-containing protein [Amycolatopsis benzoatilytica]